MSFELYVFEEILDRYSTQEKFSIIQNIIKTVSPYPYFSCLAKLIVTIVLSSNDV